MIVYISSIAIVYKMVILSPQQYIGVLFLLHGIGSEILSRCMYLVLLAQYFFFFFSSLCFLHIVVNKGIYQGADFQRFLSQTLANLRKMNELR